MSGSIVGTFECLLGFNAAPMYLSWQENEHPYPLLQLYSIRFSSRSLLTYSPFLIQTAMLNINIRNT